MLELCIRLDQKELCGAAARTTRATVDVFTDEEIPHGVDVLWICRTMVDEEGLGASEWLGGEVVSEETGLCVAVISYNGRAWFPKSVRGPEGHALAGELEFDLDV